MGSRSSKAQPTAVSTTTTSCQTDSIDTPARSTTQVTQSNLPYKESHFVSSSKFPYKKPKLVERHMRQTQKNVPRQPEELDEVDELEGLDTFETCMCRKNHCSDTDTCLGRGRRVDHRFYSDLSMSRHTSARRMSLDLHPDAQPSPTGQPADAMFHHPSSLTKGNSQLGRCSPTPRRSPLYPIHDPT